MTSADTRVNDLVVNVMTEEQFEKITPQDNQLYLTPDEDQEWKKPADWIDIRSGALPNSVYFLVGHSADYSTYPTFSVNAKVSTSANTYDVYVDGVKQATTASNTATTLTWQTLALATGYDVTYPYSLRTHIVRITPTVSTDTLTMIKTDGTVALGTLWVHFALSNAIRIQNLLSTWDSKYKNLLCEAVTSSNGVIKIESANASLEVAFYSAPLKTLPEIDLNSASPVGMTRAFRDTKLRTITLKNGGGIGWEVFRNCSELKKINTENFSYTPTENAFNACSKLEALPPLRERNNVVIDMVKGCTSIKPTFLDFSGWNTLTRFTLGGASSARLDGVKGLVVSNEAPFNNATSPQLNVSYTGLDRAALVNLFNSMPYNVGYTVAGSPTIVDGVASGFSSANYLNVATSLSSQELSNFEVGIKFTTGNSVTFTNRCALIRNYSYSTVASIDETGHFGMNIFYKDSENVAKYQAYSLSDYVLSANTTYKAVLSYDLSNVTVSLYDTSGTLLATTTQSSVGYPAWFFADDFSFRIGCPLYQFPAFNGSIDINETYIKLNGIPWFTGAAAMTKTCSVVGCTGTADLTQDDKNIALNKGWELTVA